MAQILDSGTGNVWYNKQSAKGTKATAGTTVTDTKPKLLSGVLAVKATDGMEEYVDGNRFGSPSMYRDTILGDLGTITIQVQPYTASLFSAQLLGKDTTTGASDPYTHTITSAGTAAAYGTWWQKTGAVVGPLREAFFDTKIGKAVWTAGDKQNVAHLAMDILGLQSEVFTADPTQAEDTDDPFYWPETTVASVSQIVVDGMTLGEVEEEVLEIDTGMEAWRGNDIKPNQLVEKKGTIVRAIKSVVTNETLKKFNKALYGEEAPPAGKAPVNKVFYAAIKNLYEKSASRKITIENPKVQVDPKDMAIGPLAEGGPVPISFGGQCLKEGATPALTVIVLNAAATTQA
jgi:hypothetical protein